MSRVELELAELEQLPLQDLRSRWRDIHGDEPSKTLSAQLMRLAIAYVEQERIYGGLTRQAQLKLKGLEGKNMSRSVASGTALRNNRPRASTQWKPGTRFLREWQGQTHEVTALDDGRFVHEGKAHRSLTAIARSITGTHQSGPIFFGLANRKTSDGRS